LSPVSGEAMSLASYAPRLKLIIIVKPGVAFRALPTSRPALLLSHKDMVG
jgi:hypothetical protein